MHELHPDPGADPTLLPAAAEGALSAAQSVSRDPKKPESWGKVGRNEACPCGSGKKFKHCHGAFV
jgi:preprotein translocase subunit SecA